MAEYRIAANDEPYVIYPTDVMTGDRNRRMQLYYLLVQSIAGANRIDIIVSFLMESGVRTLLKDLKGALECGVSLRILTGNYLGITQPSALYLIKHTLGDRVDLRFYNEKERSFHPKAYISHYENYSDIFIGSSNISRSALTSGIEWNYRFSSYRDRENYETFYHTFEDLFEHHSVKIDDAELRRYSKNWHRPAAAKDLDRYDESEENPDTRVRMLYEPRGAQIEALCALENARAECAVKGLVQAATGVGKTYLATDYSGLHVVRGRYDEKELNETYIGNVHRPEMIYKYYCKYSSKRALGFCCSREHAEEMAREFNRRGIPSAAVYSGDQGEYAEERSAAVKNLSDGTIRVIFSVDMFNEGVDIASLDMVMFLRPTESPVVFLQQLGRGLRTFRGKRYLTVLDFIGNYEKSRSCQILSDR